MLPHYHVLCISLVGIEVGHLLTSLSPIPGSSPLLICSPLWRSVIGWPVSRRKFLASRLKHPHVFILTHLPEAGHIGVGFIDGCWLVHIVLLPQLSYLSGGKCWVNEET